jgi:hypothetical protein
MKTHKLGLSLLALLVVVTLAGCSTSTKSRDVSDSIRKSLNEAGLKDVTVSQDRDKGVVTLGGHVAAEVEKVQAESLAKSIAAEQVVANQIAVTPPGVESEAKTVNSDLDKRVTVGSESHPLRQAVPLPQCCSRFRALNVWEEAGTHHCPSWSGRATPLGTANTLGIRASAGGSAGNFICGSVWYQ